MWYSQEKVIVIISHRDFNYVIQSQCNKSQSIVCHCYPGLAPLDNFPSHGAWSGWSNLTKYMRFLHPPARNDGKWNESKYKILMTLIALDKPATCGEIAYWSNIPAKSVWKDVWRYRKVNYVRKVGNNWHYQHRVTAKGRRFVGKMRILHLIDTNRIDNELKMHWIELEREEWE